MAHITRRSWMKSAIAAGAAASATTSMPTNAHATRLGKFQLAMSLGSPSSYPDRVQACLQMGVTHVVSSPSLRNIEADQYAAAMKKHKDEWAEAGFEIPVYETMTPVPAGNIRRNNPGPERDKELRNWIAAVEAMGKVGIPVLCYNFGQGGTRTDWIPQRGGAISSHHDYEKSKSLPHVKEIFTEDQLWDGLTWFIERIIPVCEKANVKMGYHPNDPSVSPYLGSEQIMITPTAYRRLFAIADSPYNGATFCQGNFASMKYEPGESIYSVATEFAQKDKIQFIHFRDVDGTAETKYTETFHDNGPTDMTRMFQCYYRGGFNGPIRPDHAPAMGSEDAEKTHGYGLLGKIFAFGYMIGIMQSLNMAYE